MKYSLTILLLIVAPIVAQACPVCNSATGRQVRASLLGPGLGFNLAVTLIPFAIFAFIVVLIYTGGRRPFRSRKNSTV